MDKIIHIPNISIGHFTNEQASTGCTVIICERGAVCGVDIQGEAPGTRETALLAPHCSVDKVNAILLTGGSALGLAAADGVMQYCQQKNYGFKVGTKNIPIVPAAVIYDFSIGQEYAPTAQDGYNACLSASNISSAQGNIGAGTGAVVGKVGGMESAMRGGLGIAQLKLSNELIISAIVVVNSFGDVRNYKNNQIIAGMRDNKSSFVDSVKYIMDGHLKQAYMGTNTVIGAVMTNAKLDKIEVTKIAHKAQIGVAQVITPAHTLYDGDTFFALATGEIDADINIINVATTELVKEAIQNAIFHATTRENILSYSDVFLATS
ncbi:MAG: P1 family peptidase [Thiomargarita sp.]|nr:P1 family peptidase [Thiomargarita sp.]